jgi:hypothetical protein
VEKSASSGFLSANLWSKHEAFYFRAFLRALELLHSYLTLPSNETNLNRRLYACLLKASRELDPDGLYPPPVVECCNQPDFDDSERTQRETKRPDFTWGFTDPHEADYLKSAKQFIVECKRLGNPDRPNWVLNRNYVEHGILRFIDPGWAYAQRFPSALMIGYWQSMPWQQLIAEINQAANDHHVPALVLVDGAGDPTAVNRLQHYLTRSFPISPFRLDHLWADLRDNQVTKTEPTQKKASSKIKRAKKRTRN